MCVVSAECAYSVCAYSVCVSVPPLSGVYQGTFWKTIHCCFLKNQYSCTCACRFFDEKAGLWEYASGEDETQSNPVLDFSDDLLEEEPVPMTTNADDEEGAISDPGNEVVEGTDEKVKVPEMYFYGLCTVVIERVH